MEDKKFVRITSSKEGVFTEETTSDQLWTPEYYEKIVASHGRVRNVDKNETVELVKLAKGKRSIREFAKAVGANASTISRILGGKTEEISPALLFRIVENAEEGSDVSIERMLMAQGILSDPENIRQVMRKMNDCRRALIGELLYRGYSVKLISDLDLMFEEISEFNIATDAFAGESAVWMVESCFQKDSAQTRRDCMRWLDKVMAFLYKGGKAGRISLVVESEALFNFMTEQLSKCTVPDEISVLLVSKKNDQVEDEFLAALTGGRKPDFTLGRESEREDDENA